jgi:hypothetical protein
MVRRAVATLTLTLLVPVSAGCRTTLVPADAAVSDAAVDARTADASADGAVDAVTVDAALDGPVDAVQDAALADAAVIDGAAGDASAEATTDGAVAMADIELVSSLMTGTVLVTDDFFSEGACEMVEGCIGDTGQRRLLRFDTVTANVGNADLYVGPPPADGVSEGVFTWSACHNHHHVTGYADYLLRGPGGEVVSGHKQAFCLMDTTQLDSGDPGRGYHCGNQGISTGWADTYGRYLPCQWIDVTDVVPGTYTLEITVNPVMQLPESSYNNNQLSITVAL